MLETINMTRTQGVERERSKLIKNLTTRKRRQMRKKQFKSSYWKDITMRLEGRPRADRSIYNMGRDRRGRRGGHGGVKKV